MTHASTFGQFPDGLSGASVTMEFSGQHGAPTVDARGHVAQNETFFDGTSTTDAEGPNGLLKHGIDEFPEDDYITRGILIDLPHCMGIDMLPENTTVSLDQFSSCQDKQGIAIQSGDSVLIRTGYGALFSTDPTAYTTNYPGMGQDVASYLVNLDIFLSGADNIGWDAPNTFPGHATLIAQNGIFIVENMNLELLSSACQEKNVFEFALVVNPPKIKGAAAMASNVFAIFSPDGGNDTSGGANRCLMVAAMGLAGVMLWELL